MYRVTNGGLAAIDLFGHCTGLLNPFNLVSPDCWALAFPETSGAYPEPPMPPPVKAPADLGAPDVDQVLSEQMKNWQAINQKFYEDLNSEVNPPDKKDATNWWMIGGLALVGVVALSTVGGGSPRRYGQ